MEFSDMLTVRAGIFALIGYCQKATNINAVLDRYNPLRDYIIDLNSLMLKYEYNYVQESELFMKEFTITEEIRSLCLVPNLRAFEHFVCNQIVLVLPSETDLSLMGYVAQYFLTDKMKIATFDTTPIIAAVNARMNKICEDADEE